jgi:FkbH-like protein
MASPPPPAAGLEAGDRLRAAGEIEAALASYLAAADSSEVPPAQLCLRIARCLHALDRPTDACRWALRVVDAGDRFADWHAAWELIRRCGPAHEALKLRTLRMAVLGSYTTRQLVSALRLASMRQGIALEVYECEFGQYRQEILDPDSGMYRFAPECVVLAVHAGEVSLPAFSETPTAAVEEEVRRWTGLWRTFAANSGARLVQHGFAIPPEVPLGHLASALPGSRLRMLQSLNQSLADEAGSRVTMVDCDRLAALAGKERWFDARYWHLAKQAVSLEVVPLLAKHTVAVARASLGITRKCLVLDLDNTLWGGVIGEDGLAGIRLGSGPEGEAFSAFQQYVAELKSRGVILAVSSKNNEHDAREPFERHPDMRLRLDDVAVFVANWEPKVEALRTIARTLNIGLDSLVFVDDNPVERQAIRQLLPEVDVVTLPPDPSQYVRTLSGYLHFETATFTAEDGRRTEQYRARARSIELEASAESLEDFLRSLEMTAAIEPFNDFDIPRIAQLVGKSNQFNLTTRRHSTQQLDAFRADPDCIHFSLRLRDRFTDHGLVGLMIAFVQGTVLEIDSWLMSCRVIGRTVEAEMLAHLSRRALDRGCSVLRGRYIPTAKNALVRDIFPRFGFEQVDDVEGTTTWSYDLRTRGAIRNGFIARRGADHDREGAAVSFERVADAAVVPGG